MGGGLLGSLAGAVVGAIGANVVEHKYKDHKLHKQEEQYAQQQYGPQGGLYPGYGPPPNEEHGHHHHHHHHRHGSRSRSRSRGLDEGGD